jgi:hypothetical protein
MVSAWRVELGAAVRDARLAAGLSQEELAAVLGALFARLLLGDDVRVQGGDVELPVFCRSCVASPPRARGR